jgi:predicted chitinase
MSVEAFFDAFRALKREETGDPGATLLQSEVDAINEIRAVWKPAERVNPTALADASKFYQSVHASFGTLTQPQVDGFNALLQAFGAAAWPIAFAAYGLATAWHETAATMQPVEEAYYLGDRAEAYRKTLRYYPHVGRGFVQLTWLKNYQHADDELGLGGELVKDPSLALEPRIAAKILVRGMEEGWFTGVELNDFLPENGKAGGGQFSMARRIINGNDKAALISGYAINFQTALDAGGWR